MKLAPVALLTLFVSSPGLAAEGGKAVSYQVRIQDPASQTVEIEATLPVSKAQETLYIPVWTPGYYVKEDYKKNIVRIAARDEKGKELTLTDAGANRWTVATGGARRIVVRYALTANERSVSKNEVTPTYAVLNGSATYITIKGDERLAQTVALDLPQGWVSATGMEKVGARYTAADYEALVDSPIMAGDLEVLEFTSKGTPHQVVYNRGAVPVDNAKVVADLKTMVDETRGFWNAKPWPHYSFLIAFRTKTGGGLEHSYSTFVNVNPERFATPAGYDAFVGLLAHEYQHAFNVKRLRPLELGPFDYEAAPSVSTLWISEGLTSYFSNLMVRRSGLADDDRYLAGLSRQITALQTSPGRLKQSVEQSSLGVWSNSLSGTSASDATVSYYIKGEVAGFLLDAHIRKLTNGKASLDDVMRAAFAKYAGKTGFKPEEFEAIAESVAGRSLKPWFASVIAAPGEVDYAEALDWYGLALTQGVGEHGPKFALSIKPDATAEQGERRKAWLEGR